MQEWMNSYGERVVLNDAGQLRVMGKAPATNRAQPVRRARPQPATPTLRQQVQAELAKPGNERVLAGVSEEFGTVRTFLAPKDPWSVNDAQLKARKDAVSDAEKALQSAVSADEPWAIVTRLEQSVKSAKRALASAENQRSLEQRRRRIQ